MSEEVDQTLPGPAGLFFRTDSLTSAGWHQEHEARARLERWCAYCGVSACYGFGVSLKDEGYWSCADASCRSLAEGEAMDAAFAQRVVSAPLAKPSDDPIATDLFGAAA